MQTALIGKLLQTSAHAAVLTLIILVAQRLLGRRLSPTWRAGLWWLVAIRLILPFTLPSPLSIFNLFPKATAPAHSAEPWPSPPQAKAAPAEPYAPISQAADREAPRALEATPMEQAPRFRSAEATKPPVPPPARSEAAAESADPAPIRHPIAVGSILIGLWLAGAAMLLLRLVLQSFRLLRRLRSAPAIDECSTRELLHRCAEAMGVRKIPDLAHSKDLDTPALVGVFRPRLFLPADYLERYSFEELGFIFLHELAHVRRRDLPLNWLVALLQIAHWFNPILWLAFHRWRLDRELACDAAALEAAGPHRNVSYGRTILRLLSQAYPRAATPGLVGIVEDKRQLEERICMIRDFRPGARWSLVPISLILALGIFCLTEAQQNHPAPPKNAPRPTFIGTDPEPVGSLNSTTLTMEVLDSFEARPLQNAQLFLDDDHPARAPKRLTDAQGKYIIRRPNSGNQSAQRLSLHIIHPDYAAKATNWTITSAPSGSRQTNLAIKLEKGMTIGGKVTDENGKPLAGVQVFNDHMFAWQKDPACSWGLNAGFEPLAITGPDGKWQTACLPRETANLKLTFVRPSGGFASFRADRTPLPPDGKWIYAFDDQPKLDFEELEDQKAAVSLPNNYSVKGLVVDERNRPVPHAVILEGFSSPARRSAEIKADAEGRFAFFNRSPRQWIYTISAPGHALASTVVQLTDDLTELKLVAPQAAPLRITVLDAARQPLSGARVALAGQKTEAQLIEWEGWTDSNGSATWTNAPLSPVTLIASHGERGKELTTTSGLRDYTLLLDRGIHDKSRLGLRAADGKTGVPVAMAAVWMHFRNPYFEKIAEPKSSEATVEIPGDVEAFRIEAAGYRPILLKHISAAQGDRDVKLQFQRTTGKKRILLPNDRPASNAHLWAADGTPGVLDAPFLQQHGGENRYYAERLPQTIADNDGMAELPAAGENGLIYIAHDEGTLTAKPEKLESLSEIRLQPFGRLQGRAFTAGAPAAGIKVVLRNNRLGQMAPHVLFATESKKDGSFAFEHVPPGLYQLSRNYNPGRTGSFRSGQYAYVRVKPNETTRYDYRPIGRQITGLAVPSTPAADINLLNDGHFLVAKLPAHLADRINRDDFVRRDEFTAANNARFTGSGLARERFMAQRQYALVFEESGAFHIDDVPPGEYELIISVSQPSGPARPGGAGFFEKETVAEVRREVLIPPGQGAFDLGSIHVPVTAAFKAKASNSLNLVVRNAVGGPFSLSEYLGTNVLLTVWAEWSDHSRERLDQIKTLQAEFQDRKELAFLNVLADTSGNSSGKQVHAAGRDLAKLTSALGITTLPATFLVDREGRLLARDIEGPQLRRALERVAAK